MTPERYARVKHIFTIAVELEGEQRNAYLAEECGSDHQLREEVESLIRHDDSRTIIRSTDTTLADFSRRQIGDSAQRTISTRLKHLGTLTRHVDPRGLLAFGGLISLILVSLLGFFGQRKIHDFQIDLRRKALNEIVDGKVFGLRIWLDYETQKAESWARSNELRRQISELAKIANQSPNHDKLSSSAVQEQLRAEITALAGREEDYSIWDRRNTLIADTIDDGSRIGQSATPWGAGVLAAVFEGESRLFPFDRNRSITKLDESLHIEPHLAIVTPIHDASGETIAAMQIHDDESPAKASRILRMIRFGQTGETYVFSREGRMLTRSRFHQNSRDSGVIPGSLQPDEHGTFYLRDPGGDLTNGFELEEPLSSRPLTMMARMCTSGHDGDNLDGYRDFRGVLVVGAWRWIDDFEVGVATELDVNQAEPATSVMIWETWIVVFLFALCIGVALFSVYSVHQHRMDLGENRKLGQYRLEKQIGEGGMGKVFKAQHELLRRPTAIKLLKPELVDWESHARFEREARLVSQLEHPNTIRVYDYGVTPEGLFYFVMEHVDGLNLSELVELEGPLPPGRAVSLVKQICLSLREAHDLDIVHRDLKPSNIMVCRRGGEFDIVKVLDFGLVKPINTPESQAITATDLVAGTPQYIPPERLSDPDVNDPRSDLYALGAVVYFLLSGRNAIEGRNLADILYQVVNEVPAPPSSLVSHEIPPALDELVIHCLAKAPDSRPQSVTEILAAVMEIESYCQWTESHAQAWWAKFDRLKNG